VIAVLDIERKTVANVLEIVIPAYNEESRLGATLQSLRTFVQSDGDSLAGECAEVIVVDNGSTDRTAAVARSHSTPELAVRVVCCPVRGKGAATRFGVADTTADLVAFMDADGATDFDALGEGIRLVGTGVEVAVGSRSMLGSNVSARHTLLRQHGAAAFRALSGAIVPGIADTQCGLKVMRGDVARGLFRDLTVRGFSFDVELLALAQRRVHRVVEFPVHWVDKPGSTFRPAVHGFSSFLHLAKLHRQMRQVPHEAVPHSYAAPRCPGGHAYCSGPAR
jgi:dolichyl-phosphate beta-glucosyltransferase